MRNLIVEIELDGESVYVGNIIGNDYQAVRLYQLTKL